MKVIQKIKQILNNIIRRATSQVAVKEDICGGIASKALLGHGVASARRHGRGAPSTSVVTSGESSKRLAGDSHSISSLNLNNNVLRHGLFLSLYSLIKKASGKLPWRSRTNSLNTTRNYIKNFRRIRILGSASLFSLGLLLLATFVPLYNVTRTEDTEAAAGTAKDSSITFTATRSTASVDLTVTSENGTFASSTSSNQAAFSLSTTNFTGYTLTIASNTNTSALTNTNGGSLSSISSSIDESTFNTSTYNNKWGYKPNYYGSAANSDYLPSPTTTATTLDETSSANSTAKNYTIALGARADYTNASGTYSSSNYKLMYVANPVAYSISFDKGSAAENPSNMPAVVTGSVSAMTVDLPSTIPTRTAYDFIGWCLGTITTTNNVDTCSNANVYNPDGDGTNLAFGIDRESSNTGVTLHAMWKIKTFTCSAQYRLQNADGTFPDTYTPDTANDSTTTYGGSCSYSKTVTNYKGSSSGSNGSAGSASASNVTSARTLSISFYRNTYALTVTAGSNTSSATGGGTYRWGQTVTVGVTKATNVTCTTYATPTWSRTSGSGTLNATSGTSVTFTMGKGAATVTATSAASNVAQTVTLSKNTGVSGISIGGTNYTGTSASLNCGTYNISGNYDSNYEFSSWEAANSVTVASTSTASTTMTVSGAGTLTLNAKQSCSGTMQNFNPTSNMTSATLCDNRGGVTKAYTVAKLADGKWWMTSNLELPGGTKLTSSDSNVSSDYDLPASSPDFSSDYAATVYNSGSTNCSASKACYSYYSYLAATAGTGSSVSNDGYNASGSICPKGWRLPTATTSNAVANLYNNWKTGDFYALATAYGANLESNYYDSSSSTGGKFYTNAGPGTTPNFLLSGRFYGTSFSYGGSRGYYWSSTALSSTYAYNLHFGSGYVYSADNSYRRDGFAVRCVLMPTMQDATTSSLATLMPNTGDTATLVDSRDGKEYSVAKLADGKYWMTSNLDLAGGTKLTSSDSNVTSVYTLPASSASGFSNYSTAYVYNSGRTTCSSDSSTGSCYSYYSYAAATAGTNPSSGAASSDICPYGWRLPTLAEYNTLKGTYTTGATLTASPFYGVYSGYYISGSFGGGGSGGNYWSSTASGSSLAYPLVFNSSSADTNYYSKSFGFAVRCVFDTTMQGATASSLAASMPNTGDTTTLVDSRDGEEYLIGKLADGKYWMLDNLRLGVTDLTVDITSSNTNTNTTIDKATWNGYRKTSEFSSYTSPMFNSASANNTTTGYGSGSKKIGVYYNYCAASAGTICSSSNSSSASYDICPKGWRMPTGGSSGEYKALYTAYSSDATNFRAALSTPLSGLFINSSASDQGSNGSFWSSTYGSVNNMYYLSVNSSSVFPAYIRSRGFGFSVRCILK